MKTISSLHPSSVASFDQAVHIWPYPIFHDMIPILAGMESFSEKRVCYRNGKMCRQKKSCHLAIMMVINKSRFQEDNIVKLKIISLLTFIISFSSFLFFATVVFAFQNMLCSSFPSSSKSGRTSCKTHAADNSLVKIVCESTPTEDITIYACTTMIRDWGKSSSPYAHTSNVWRCVSDSKESFIFDTDFKQDDIRCDIVCGKCSKTWKKAQ